MGQNFQQVLEFEQTAGSDSYSSKEYHTLTRGILNQHRGTMLDVAKGVFEFTEDLNELFGSDLQLAEVREDLRLIQDIEQSLDEFFTNRLTLRLLISHIHGLNGTQEGAIGKQESSDEQEMVGVVNVNTQPITILTRAYAAARFMCMRDFQMAPDLLVNGVAHDDFLAEKIAVTKQHRFAYVHTHLFYIFLELVKNAARASIEQANAGKGKLESPKANYQPCAS